MPNPWDPIDAAVLQQMEAEAAQRREARLRKEKYELRALSQTLAQHKWSPVDRIEVDVDGYSDEGGIEEVRYFRQDKMLSPEIVEKLEAEEFTVTPKDGTEAFTTKIGESVHNTATRAIEATGHQGWADGLGSFSLVEIRPLERSVVVDYKERMEVLGDSENGVFADDLEDFCEGE